MADRNTQIVIGLRNQASPEIRALVADNRTLIATLQQEGATLEQAERKMLSLAQAAARAQAATGNLAESERTLTAGLLTATQSTTSFYNSQTQLANVQRKASGEVGGLTGAVNGLKSAVGTLGVAFGVQQLISFGVESGRAALQLRETENTLRALAGSTANYNQVISTARQQQVLFGGSLQENIAGLQGLVITSRSTGAELNTLINLSQRLAVLDPAQGAEGARIALSEVLSGDPRSLARRYEIPLSALSKIKDESIPVAQRLQVLDQYLNKIGITSEVISGRVDQTAQSYRRLAQAADDARNVLGNFLANAGQQSAQTATNILGVFQGTRQGFVDAGVGVVNFTRQLAGLPPLSAQVEAGLRSQAQATADGYTAVRDYIAGLLGIRTNTPPVIGVMDEERQAAAKLAGQLNITASATRGLASAQGALAGLPKTLSDTSKVVNVDPRKQTILNFGNALGGGLKGAFDQQAQQAQRLAQLQLQNRLINAQTSAERIGILKQELAGTTDVLERQRIQNEIDQERASAAKGHTSELNKQLNLNERIYDSVNKQLAAQLDLSAAIIQDRQARRDEQKEIDKADKIIGRLAGRTDARALDLLGRATDQRDLDRIQQQQRQLRIQELQATAGASIVNGKLYQSVPGGGTQPTFQPIVPGPGGAPTGGGAATAGQAGQGVTIVNNFNVDGKTIFSATNSYIWDTLMQAINQQKAQVGA